jgi:hypothetical protein
MIYRAVILISLTAAILFVGGLTTYPSPLVERSRPMAKTDDPSRLTQSRHSEPLPRPRDPEITIREEYDLAKGRGSAEAFELFIARHPNHALVAEARREMERLKGVR